MKRLFSSKFANTCAVVLLALLLSGTVVKTFYSAGVLEARLDTSDFQYSDVYNAIMYNENKCHVSKNVVLVDIHNCDNAQIFETLDSVEKYSPLAIGLDVIFRQHDTLPIGSRLAEYDNVVLGVDSTLLCPSDNYFTCLPERNVGIVRADVEGLIDVVRTFRTFYTYDGVEYRGFPLEVVRVASPDKYSVFVNDKRVKEENRATIYYQDVVFDIVSADTILAGASELGESYLRNRIVLVGDLHDSQDLFLTPLSKTVEQGMRRGPMSGLGILAYSVETVLNGPLVYYASKFTNWSVAVLVTLLLLLLCDFINTHFPTAGSLLVRLAQICALFVFLIIGCACFRSGKFYIDFVPAMLMISISSFSKDVWDGVVAIVKKGTKK